MLPRQLLRAGILASPRPASFLDEGLGRTEREKKRLKVSFCSSRFHHLTRDCLSRETGRSPALQLWQGLSLATARRETCCCWPAADEPCGLSTAPKKAFGTFRSQRKGERTRFGVPHTVRELSFLPCSLPRFSPSLSLVFRIRPPPPTVTQPALSSTHFRKLPPSISTTGAHEICRRRSSARNAAGGAPPLRSRPACDAAATPGRTASAATGRGA